MYNPNLLKKGLFFDRILHRLFSSRKKNNSRVPLSEIPVQKILLLESHLIGDMVMSTPVMAALSSRYPEVEIHLLANKWAEDLLGNSPHLARIITARIPWSTYDYSLKNLLSLLRTVLALRKEAYDLAIDPRGDMRNNFLLWFTGAKRRLGYGITGGVYFLTDVAKPHNKLVHLIEHRMRVLEPLGVHGEMPLPQLHISPDLLDKARSLLAVMKAQGRIVAIHPGASQPDRRWSAHNHAAVIKRLNDLSVSVVLVGGPGDSALLEDIVAQTRDCRVMRVQPSLAELAAIFSLVDALIAMDSAAAHIGAAASCPVAVVFGSADPRRSQPWGQNVKVIVPASSPPRIDGVSSNMVLDALAQMLGIELSV